ncbi:MAG: hypothetical protein VYC96_04545 [Actinomycetota bacterium]|nr:hypothetical protein [Actinomycetota bacterium]
MASIIGALTDAARDLAAQLSPGVRIRFRVATIRDAGEVTGD